MVPEALNTTRDVYQPTTQDARGGGTIASGGDAHLHEGNAKLVPWLMLSSMLGGVAIGVSATSSIATSHAESRMESTAQNTRASMESTTQNMRTDLKADIDRQYRFLQELRVRVEDAEMAAKEVNPNFKPVRQPKEH